MGRKVGVMFILIGFCIPSILFFLAEGHYPRTGLLGNIHRMELRFKNPNYPSPQEREKMSALELFDARAKAEEYIIIPYRYSVILGILLVCVGTGAFILSKLG